MAAEEHCLPPVIPESVPLQAGDVPALGVVGIDAGLKVLAEGGDRG